MVRRIIRQAGVFALAGLCPAFAPPLLAAVNLEWRVLQHAVPVGEMVEIGLYAVSDTTADQSVGAMEVIFTWDPSRLKLMSLRDPCPDDPCPANTYNWLTADFPYDGHPDPPWLNTDCGPSEFCIPYTGHPYNDGNALFLALGKFAPNPPAIATSEGLWVTSFLFRALSAGETEVGFVERFGVAARTLVTSGETTGLEVTGQLGSPAQVVIVECLPPTVWAIGSRYLSLTPAPGELPVGILVEGDIENPDVACVSQYVQADGRLGASLVLRTPSEWGTMRVGDLEIVPDAIYDVRASCGQIYGLSLLSEPRSAITWMWGDVDDSGAVNFDDIILVISGFQGVFQGDTILENLDLAGCIPNRKIDADDIACVQEAVGGAVFPCLSPCSPGSNLHDFAALLACLGGPSADVVVDCRSFDVDGDNDVDLADFAVFQTSFGQP